MSEDVALIEMISTLSWATMILAVAGVAYAYAIYPGLLYLVGAFRRGGPATSSEWEWPTVTITLPVYNEELTVARTLDSLLALDYPTDRLQLLVVSDASTDRTDEIVAGYRERGVELLRLTRRAGKTTAENAARRRARGDIVVNTDASVHVPPGSLKPLIAVFADDSVGVASGRDVSVGPGDDPTNAGEAGYVGYEMWVRDLETRAGGIIGTSGCFFASRRELSDPVLPAGLSWDFVAPLIARENGYRAVSVPDARCHVPRTSSLRREYRRKVRTMARGMRTLLYKKHVLNPFRYGAFAWMLFSHKICRWAVPWLLALAAAALAALAISRPWVRWLALPATGFALLAGIGWLWPEEDGTPRIFALPAYVIAGNLAAMHAAVQALTGQGNAIWEPTRRTAVRAPQAASGRPKRG